MSRTSNYSRKLGTLSLFFACHAWAVGKTLKHKKYENIGVGQDIELITTDTVAAIKEEHRDEAWGSVFKLGTGAAGWQALGLLYQSRYMADIDISQLTPADGHFWGYSAFTGLGAAMALNAGMFSGQYVLHRYFGSDTKPGDLKTCAWQLMGSMTFADGLWQLANYYSHIPKAIPVLPYIGEALVFSLLQYGLHGLTIKYPARCLGVKSTGLDEKFIAEETSFKPSLLFTAVVAGAYIGFDYATSALNDLFQIESSSKWTTLTSGVGTAAGAGAVYAGAAVITNCLARACGIYKPYIKPTIDVKDDGEANLTGEELPRPTQQYDVVSPEQSAGALPTAADDTDPDLDSARLHCFC
jgi:hypothetical protein